MTEGAPSHRSKKTVSPDKPHYAGHRSRLRERFMRDLGASMEDYEILEMLLTLALPRVDTKPIAKDLLNRFGNFAGVITADPIDLAKTKGIKEASIAPIKLVQTAALRLARQQIMEQPVISSWDKLISYLHIAMSREKVEHLRLLFLDNKNRLIADEVQQRGTVNHTPLYPREVMKRALELHASALILVHNHPSGDPTPSRDDIHMTNEIRDAAEKLGIRLHDHIIIGRNEQTSFKAEGLL
ncbi:RadC family protein [Hwanghaeella sp.]|uniref:RadC family protein n=1 Tax=Hwanghaeella sp. TaxID=2605943 RepID=UPI003CCBE022